MGPAWAVTAQELYDDGIIAKENGNLQAAREAFVRILNEFLDYEFIAPVRKELQEVTLTLINSPLACPEVKDYQVEPGDTLQKIARQHGTTVELIRRRNKIKDNFIRAGDRLTLWVAPFEIHINKSKNILQLMSGVQVVKAYPVSTGKQDSQTPLGEFTIAHRYPNPVWFHHGDIVPAGTPENFLGTRWLGFDKPKFGIHGTVQPELIGQSVSGGCVRMRNEDVEELYDLVPIGTKVVIAE